VAATAPAGLWHDERMHALARMIAGLLSDSFRLFLLLLRSSTAIRAENLVLRKQLAQYIERGVRPRRIDAVARISLALLTRLFDWQNAVVIVRQKTIIRWHRAGWRLFWRFKCKLGRLPIPAELRALIRRMASENYELAIDDFGTGYSSLAYLSKLPIQSLKIDRSFVCAMLENSDGATLVRMIIELGRPLRLKVVAEGVETDEQAAFLEKSGCDEMQGYLISKPLPLAEAVAFATVTRS